MASREVTTVECDTNVSSNYCLDYCLSCKNAHGETVIYLDMGMFVHILSSRENMIDNICVKIGSRIKELASQNSIEIQELVYRLNYSYKDKSRITEGELIIPPIEIERIAKIFNKTKQEFIQEIIE